MGSLFNDRDSGIFLQGHGPTKEQLDKAKLPALAKAAVKSFEPHALPVGVDPAEAHPILEPDTPVFVEDGSIKPISYANEIPQIAEPQPGSSEEITE